MTTTVLTAVDLLERAVGYTRGTLAGVTADQLHRPTPCSGWDLHRLLLHMDDALAAFTEASAGYVALRPAPATGPVLDRIRQQACALLGAWADPPGHERVAVGGRPLPTDLLVCTGALEITLHGWDVGRALGRAAPIPDDLARRLLPVAAAVIAPGDRPARFARVRPVEPGSSYDVRLLAYSGRHS